MTEEIDDFKCAVAVDVQGLDLVIGNRDLRRTADHELSRIDVNAGVELNFCHTAGLCPVNRDIKGGRPIAGHPLCRDTLPQYFSPIRCFHFNDCEI